MPIPCGAPIARSVGRGADVVAKSSTCLRSTSFVSSWAIHMLVLSDFEKAVRSEFGPLPPPRPNDRRGSRHTFRYSHVVLNLCCGLCWVSVVKLRRCLAATWTLTRNS